MFTPKPIPSVQRSWNSSVQQLQESRSQGWSDCFLWTASQAPDLRFSEETNPGPLCLIPPFPKAAAWPSRLEPINSGICQSVRLVHGSKEMSYTDLARSQELPGVGSAHWEEPLVPSGLHQRSGGKAGTAASRQLCFLVTLLFAETPADKGEGRGDRH